MFWSWTKCGHLFIQSVSKGGFGWLFAAERGKLCHISSATGVRKVAGLFGD
jgi:hypothetical protein